MLYNNIKKLLVIFGILLVLVGCSPRDPIDTFYTQDVLPGTTGLYDIGALATPYDNGYFNDIWATNIHGVFAPVGLTTPRIPYTDALGNLADDADLSWIVGTNTLDTVNLYATGAGVFDDRIAVNTVLSATQLASLYSNDGAQNNPVLSVTDNSGSGASQSIYASILGAKTGDTYGVNINNSATSGTGGINKYGLNILSQSVWNGAGANNYALYIQNPTGGTTNYSIYSAGGLNYFSGQTDISWGSLSLVLGADNAASTRTNNTNKYTRIGSAHYDNTEQPLALINASSGAGTSDVEIGGGSASMNAATRLRFITAANTTTVTGTLISSIDIDGSTLEDDKLFRLGTSNDQVFLNRSTALGANTPLANVLIGTPVSQAIDTNSLMISNTTAGGDMAFYTNRAGNSQQWLFHDNSSTYTAIRDGYTQVANLQVLGSGYVWVAEGGGLYSNANNQAAISCNMGLAAPDATAHNYNWKFASTIYMQLGSTGNGAGGVTDVRLGLGSASSTLAHVFQDFPEKTYATAANFSRELISSTNAITVNTNTVPVLSTLSLSEPNITIGTGAVTTAATLCIAGAPTEGSANYALVIVSGNNFLGSGNTSIGAGGLGITATGGNYGINVSSVTDSAIRARGVHSTLAYNTINAQGTFEIISGDSAQSEAKVLGGVLVVGAGNNKNWTNAVGARLVSSSLSITAGATGTITGSANFFAANTIGAMTVTNLYGNYISNATGAGTVVNQYGVYIEALTKGTTLNWGIYNLGDTYNAGLFKIGSLVDSVAKDNKFISTQYATTAEPEGFMMFGVYADATHNITYFGGNANYNAPTAVQFYVAANVSTRSGTKVMDISTTAIDMVDSKVQNIKMLNMTDPTELTIAAGVITVTQGYHTVDTESDAASDDLVTINGGGIGDIITLAGANDAREVKLTRTGNIRFQPEHMIEGFGFASPSGGSGTFYTAGYYDAPVADANLTQASTTVTRGTANSPYGARAFLVAGGAGTTNAGTVSIVVSGTSVTGAGVRTVGDTETLVANITTMALNSYYQTTKKWVSTVTWTLTAAGGATVYAADFNYGLAAYDSFDERSFTVKLIEVMGRAGANDTGFDIQLLHHKSTGWTYSAAAFVPGNGAIATLVTDYSTDNDLVTNERFKWEREVNTAISGNTTEGFLVRVITTANKAVEFMNISVYAEVLPNDMHLKTTGQAINMIYNGTNWMTQ